MPCYKDLNLSAKEYKVNIPLKKNLKSLTEQSLKAHAYQMLSAGNNYSILLLH